jgi:AraC-like DNA-binding protein
MRLNGRKEAVIALRQEHPDLTVADLVERTGVSQNSVYQVLKDAGLSPPRKARQLELAKRIITLREQHPDWPATEIGNEVGLSGDRVGQMLRDAGMPLPRRGPREADSTKKRIIALRKLYPDWTMVRIAAEVGLSHQRVGQALTRAGLPTKAHRPPVIVECARENCGTRWQKDWRNKETLNPYCSVECREAVRRIAVRCTHCGAEKTIGRGSYRIAMGLTDRGKNKDWPRYTGRFFCDRACWGAYAGENYGFGRRRVKEKSIARLKEQAIARQKEKYAKQPEAALL